MSKRIRFGKMQDVRAGLKLIRKGLKKAHDREIHRIMKSERPYVLQAQDHIVSCVQFAREIEHHAKALEDIELRYLEGRAMDKPPRKREQNYG